MDYRKARLNRYLCSIMTGINHSLYLSIMSCPRPTHRHLYYPQYEFLVQWCKKKKDSQTLIRRWWNRHTHTWFSMHKLNIDGCWCHHRFINSYHFTQMSGDKTIHKNALSELSQTWARHKMKYILRGSKDTITKRVFF